MSSYSSIQYILLWFLIGPHVVLSFQSCGDIYKGLAQTGAWGCFDEFNRISVEVLSVIAVQVSYSSISTPQTLIVISLPPLFLSPISLPPLSLSLFLSHGDTDPTPPQVKSVQDAIRDKKIIFNFLGETIKLIPTVGAFITMNPGYAGRAELPENLKALFRYHTHSGSFSLPVYLANSLHLSASPSLYLLSPSFLQTVSLCHRLFLSCPYLSSYLSVSLL